MAKIVKVKISRELLSGGRIRNTYPPEYDSTKIRVLSYEDLNDVNKTFCIGVVSDADAPAFLESADITEVTSTEARTLGTSWRPQVTKITDEQTIISILNKVRNSQSLTQAEKDAINPDNATFGVNKSRPFNELLTEALNG
jgi:hypothetical protein